MNWDSDSKGRQTKSKKITMKIGKFLAKIVDLYKKQKVYLDKIYVPLDRERLSDPLYVRKRISEILTDDELKRFYQIHNLLSVYLPDMQKLLDLYKAPVLRRKTGFYDPLKRIQLEPEAAIGWASGLSDYWQKNAAFIKEKVNDLRNDTYSMIITRHPIDVLRMSDFENITSCHSPPSIQGIYQAYYKCAVAEARGHGAVAYIVLTKDLLEGTGTENIKESEAAIQEGEIFEDETRGGDIGVGLTPVSRIRIRKLAYYQTTSPKRWDEGTQLAVPEYREYGENIPGFYDRLRSWSYKEQETESLPDIPKTESGLIDGEKIYMFGGTYYDNSPNSILANFLFQKQDGKRLITNTSKYIEGTIKVNSDTEDELSAEDLGDAFGIMETQVNDIVEQWDNRYASVNINANVEADYGEGYYINVSADMHIKWQSSEWKSYPSRDNELERWSATEINDRLGSIFDEGSARLTYLGDGGGVRWSCGINLEHPTAGGNGQYLAMTEDLEDTCVAIDRIDDYRDAIKSMLEAFFKREGFMSGGEYIKLAMEIEGGQLESYEWDLESDGGYEESYESTASYSFYYDPPDWGMEPSVMIKILSSREFKILLKAKLLEPARKEVDTEYYLKFDARISQLGAGSDIRVAVKFLVNSDDPDEMSELFSELVTGDLDDEDNLAIIFNEALVQMKKEYDLASKGDNINENLIKSWRNFIS